MTGVADFLQTHADGAATRRARAAARGSGQRVDAAVPARARRGAAQHAGLLALQRTAGNRAVASLMASRATTADARARPRFAGPATLQRKIDVDAVQQWTKTRDVPKPPFIWQPASAQTARVRRDYYELTMLLEELQRRYPATLPPWSLIADLVARLNQDDPITMAHIRELLAGFEIERGLDVTYTRKDMVRDAIRRRYPGQLPAREVLIEMIGALNALPLPWTRADVEATITGIGERHEPPAPRRRSIPLFLSLMEDRRGAHAWDGSLNKDFDDWLGSTSPLARSIPVGATLNCWEVVLFAAAHAGLLSIQAIRSYRKDVFTLLSTQARLQELDRDQPKNAVRAGDIITLESGGNKVHHVMAVIGESASDFKEIPIMSLWGKLETGGFTRTTLGAILELGPVRVIRYFRF